MLPLSKLDTQLIDLLMPVAESDQKIKVLVAFYANTLPLAFHYAQALRLASLGDDDINERIRLVSWGEEELEVRSPAEGEVVAFFSSREEAEKRDLVQVPVTVFQPRWVFTEFNLKVLSQIDEQGGAGSPPDLETFGTWLGQAFSRFEVVTEMMPQAREHFARWLGLEGQEERLSFTGSAESSTLFRGELLNGPLRMFLFGAPLSHYFARKPNRYLQLRLGEQGGPAFETVVSLTGNVGTRVIDAISDYHSVLYQHAAHVAIGEEEPQSFRSLQHHYNLVANCLQHRSSFDSPREYAKCISDHHHELEAT